MTRTAIRAIPLVALIVVAAWFLHGISGGGQGGNSKTNRDKGESYIVHVDWSYLRYVVDIETVISNKPTVYKMDATGEHGLMVEDDAEWNLDVIYKRGTGGIVLTATVSSANPPTTVVHCEIWISRNGIRSLRVSEGFGDRGKPAECRWDRPGVG